MATIIKRGEQAPQPAGDAVRGVSFDLEELTEHGDRYVSHVRQEAAKIVQQANANAERVRSNAESAGRLAAEQTIDKLLSKKIGEQMQTLKPAIDQMVGQIETAHDEWLRHWEHASIELAGQMAERIVRREIAQRPEITAEWAREALELSAGGSEVTVRLNPSDYENLGEHVETVAQSLSGAGEPHVVADPTVSAGGCVVETRHGVIDAQVETQIARLLDELK